VYFLIRFLVVIY